MLLMPRGIVPSIQDLLRRRRRRAAVDAAGTQGNPVDAKDRNARSALSTVKGHA
jgi:hypothetical protein